MSNRKNKNSQAQVGGNTSLQCASRKFAYSERHQYFPDTVVVSYPFYWGGHMADRRMWLAELNGEVWDYDTKASLVDDALRNGYAAVVLRVHRDGTASVVEQYPHRQAASSPSHDGGCLARD